MCASRPLPIPWLNSGEASAEDPATAKKMLAVPGSRGILFGPHFTFQEVGSSTSAMDMMTWVACVPGSMVMRKVSGVG